MADKKTKIETEDAVIVIENIETSQKLRNLWSKFKKPFITGLVVGLLLGGGYFAYQSLVKAPKIEKAAEAVFPVENFFDKMAASGFNKDSIAIALNGGVVDSIKVEGLISIINKHGGTPAANRACYMAGACYLNNGEYDKAIKNLNDFDANGAYQLDIKKHILLGHANAELKKTEAALSEYAKAATINTKDEPFTTDALITAAAYAETLGKTKEAIDFYQKVKDNYPASQAAQNGDIDKYLAKLGVTK